VTEHATVYIYMFILVGFARPLLDFILIYNNRLIKGQLVAPGRVAWLVPSKYKPLPSEMPTDRSFVLFSMQNYIVKIFSYIIILITFDAVCPPLAFIGCISIIIFTYHEQLLMGRLLTEANENNLHFVTELIKTELSTTSSHFSHTAWLIVPLASCFLPFFVFDPIGDSVGWHRAIWAPMLILAFSPTLWTCLKLREYLQVFIAPVTRESNITDQSHDSMIIVRNPMISLFSSRSGTDGVELKSTAVVA
jgi:hypothetical protein